MVVANESADFLVESQVLWGLNNQENLIFTTDHYREMILTGQWDQYSMTAPKGFNSCISRNICSQIVDLYGSLYLPLAPDYTHSFMALNLGKDVMHLAQPLAISANLKESQDSKIKAFQSDESFYQQYGVTKEESTEFCPIKSDVLINWNIIYNDLYKVMLTQDYLINREQIFEYSFLAATLHGFRKYKFSNTESQLLIEKIVETYLHNLYPQFSDLERQKLSKTIKYIFDLSYNQSVIPQYTTEVKSQSVIKDNLKKLINLIKLNFTKRKKEDVFSLFLKNKIIKNKIINN
jgi:hypothetical protein